MSTPKLSANTEQCFLSRVAELQKELIERGIDYRVLGSLGAAAVLAGTEDAIKLDTNRRHWVSPDKQYPDIDLLVPRRQLQEAWRVRDYFLSGQSGISIKAGLAIGLTTIDYRPDKEWSRLYSSGVRCAVQSALFDPVWGGYEGTPVRTIDPLTLAHTYGTIGGKIRPKDRVALAALRKVAETHSEFADEDYGAFDRFNELRRGEMTRLNKITGAITGLAIRHVPSRVVSSAGRRRVERDK